MPHSEPVAAEPWFPSGPWTGFYLDRRSPGRHQMDLDLQFTRGKIGGGGTDNVGIFTIRGRYSKDGECVWTKEYASHWVAYRGFREGKGIWGTWELRDTSGRLHGGFQIWPKGIGAGASEQVEAEAPVPAQALAVGPA